VGKLRCRNPARRSGPGAVALTPKPENYTRVVEL
jgi:hypothetical protein